MGKQRRKLRWWYFRPWSPPVLGAVTGGVLTGLFTPGIASSWQDGVWRDYGYLLCGVVLGAIVGLAIDLAMAVNSHDAADALPTDSQDEEDRQDGMREGE